MAITLVNLSARNSYPAVCSSMAGGKETRKVLPLALVHTQVSRDDKEERLKSLFFKFSSTYNTSTYISRICPLNTAACNYDS